jgi:hypothetical protein
VHASWDVLQVVRSSQELPQGGEVSLAWLGSLLTAPLAARQQELRTQYKFDCACARWVGGMDPRLSACCSCCGASNLHGRMMHGPCFTSLGLHSTCMFVVRPA